MKTVLVTGSDGFIGRHLVGHLAQAGWRVMGVVRRGSGSPALSAIWPDLKSAGEALQKNRVDVVVHCAGLAHADAQAADAPALTAVNVDHTLDFKQRPAMEVSLTVCSKHCGWRWVEQ